MKISLRGVVENLEETPSSQERAFWRETLGAAATMSVPEASLAKDLRDAPIRSPATADQVARFTIVDAITDSSLLLLQGHQILNMSTNEDDSITNRAMHQDI